MPLQVDYREQYSAASKAGMIALAKSIAQELGPKGVRANAVAPGFIETAMTAQLPEEIRKDWMKKIPLRRGGQTEDIAVLTGGVVISEEKGLKLEQATLDMLLLRLV